MAVIERLGGCCHGFKVVKEKAKSRMKTVTKVLFEIYQMLFMAGNDVMILENEKRPKLYINC